jgi:hypothetical protein
VGILIARLERRFLRPTGMCTTGRVANGWGWSILTMNFDTALVTSHAKSWQMGGGWGCTSASSDSLVSRGGGGGGYHSRG